MIMSDWLLALIPSIADTANTLINFYLQLWQLIFDSFRPS